MTNSTASTPPDDLTTPRMITAKGGKDVLAGVDSPRNKTQNMSTHSRKPSLRTSSPRATSELSGYAPAIPQEIPDDDLVARTLAGDKEAYRLLVEKYESKLLGLALDVLKSREDAEDVVQEAFVKAFLSLRSFKGQSSFYTWIYRITYNMAIDVKRRVARRGGTHIEFKETPSVTTSAGDGAHSLATVVPESAQTVEGPAEALYRRETGAKLQEVLDELSPEHRAVIVLREVDGLNYEEISEATGIPKGTVMSRLHYARKSLQKALRDFAPAVFGNRGSDADHESAVDSQQAKGRANEGSEVNL